MSNVEKYAELIKKYGYKTVLVAFVLSMVSGVLVQQGMISDLNARLEQDVGSKWYALGNHPYTFMASLAVGDSTTLCMTNGTAGTLMWTTTNSTAFFAAIVGNSSETDVIRVNKGVTYGACTFLSDCFVMACTAGATLVAGDAVYFDGSTGKFGLADADSNTTLGYGFAGLAVTNASDTELFLMLTEGTFRNTAWSWTVGYRLYFSTTAGDLTDTKLTGSGEYVYLAGWARNSTSIELAIGKTEYKQLT